MAVFAYKAKTEEGKVTRGKIEAMSKKEALAELGMMDLIVFEVEPLNSFLNTEINLRSGLKPKDFIIFLRQFATLISAGILLVESLDLLAEQPTNPRLKAILEDLSTEVQEGSPPSVSMSKHPAVFPNLLIQMIQSAEVSGRLEEVLEQMANYYEKQYRNKQNVTTAMSYPIVVGILALVITALLLIFIVPIFGEMFASFGSELPAITQMVLGLSQWFQKYWVLILVFLLATIFLLRYLSQRDKMAYSFDYLQLKIPIIGMFLQKTILARMTQTLSSLLNSSVPILQALDVTSQVVDNRVVEEVLIAAKKDVEQGESLAKPMEAHWFFPNLIIQMIKVGEASGSLDEMLKKASDIYEQEVEEASEKLQSLIEPLLIVFLSVIVGFIVLSIVIPMFGLFEQIQ